MKIEHNSQVQLYRSPFGAVTCGTKVTLRLSLVDFGIPRHIRVVYEFEDSSFYKNMQYVFEVAGACIYETEIELPDKTGLVHYYFDIASEDTNVFYGDNEDDFGGVGMVYDEQPPHKFQITVYDKSYVTPRWWRDCVCYQIFPDRFSKGGEKFLSDRKDIIKREWGDEPYYKAEQFGGSYLSNDFFGGNLLGIENKLDYLQELGISCIYLNPIFKAYSNHRYDTGDYKTIDPMLGCEADFIRLCKKAKEKGIRIILDGVFNHTGSDSLYFNKNGTYESVGAYQSQKSPYYDWYRFSEFPDKYESWWGIDTLPQIEEKCEGYQDYILKDEDSVVKKWIRLGASGWRLDVVDELPDFFVKILRAEVKKQNKDAVIIGEVWEDASNKIAYDEKRQYFMGEELDSVMNYPLRNALVEFVKGNIDAKSFSKRVMSLKENYPRPAFYAALNFVSTHDVERAITALGGKAGLNKEEQAQSRLSEKEKGIALRKLECLITLQVLLPGVPCVYYGDEAGLEGYADPFCRRCFPWGNEDWDIFNCYKKTICLRNENEAFKDGELETVYEINNGYGFIRYKDDKQFVVLINTGGEETFRLDIARFGINKMCEVFKGESYSSDDGIYFIKMAENSVKIFKKINQ